MIILQPKVAVSSSERYTFLIPETDKDQKELVNHNWGRTIAQAVSHWIPTAAARVRALVWSCGICGGQSGAGAGFL
jgi:hypothetical protein